VDRGLLVQFEGAEALASAVRALRDQGYERLEAHTPFPAHEVEQAMDPKKPPIPALALLGAALGGTGAYLLQWWTQAVDYPVNVGGRPDHAAPSFMLITFETAILFAALFTFVGFLVMCRLPRLWRPIFEVEGFSTIDGWWLAVDAADGRFDPEATEGVLQALSPVRIERFGGGA
jgi:hypothetical protein